MGETPETLWTAWRTGRDARAFEALVRPHLRFAFDLARRTGCGAADAEDVVQESLVILAREKGDGPARAGVRAWLGRVVRVQAHTQRRSSARRARRERASGVVERGAGGAGPETREQVEAALAHLNPDEREAVVLRYLHDLDYAEIAFVLKASENACRIRVHRAMERLRSLLGGGAAALVAALGLPATGAEAAVLKGAVAGAGAAPVAAGGIVIMTTATKVMAAAVVASATTAVAFLATGIGRSERAPARSTTSAERPRERLPAVDPLESVDAAPDEVEFLRTALAKERVRREDARIRADDTGLDIVRRVVESGADVTDLLWDYDQARSHVRPKAGPVARIVATGDVTPVDLSKAAAGALVIEFGPGTFKLERSEWHELRENVESLEVRGAGMDKTTLVATTGTLLTVIGSLVHLRVADLTFDGGEEREEQILDVRGGASAAFENVRFRRWMSGGYAAPVGAMGGAFVLFRGCEFLGGFGISQSVCALAIRGDVIAAFEQCVFADVTSVVMGGSGAARDSIVLMDECTFENSALSDSRFLYRGRPECTVRVRGGRVHFGSPDLSDDERRKKWGAEYAAELLATQFSAEIPRCTLGDLVQVLERYRPSDGSLVGGIHLVTAHRGGADQFWLMLVGPDGAGRNPIIVQVRDGRIDEIPRGRRGGPGGNDPKLVTRCRPLGELLRASGLPLDTGCTKADYAQRYINGEMLPVVYVGADWPPKIVLDGQTGARIRLP